jgi:hypothetical protein
LNSLSDEQLRPECEDLDLSHGPTRLLAAALYWRRTAVERKAPHSLNDELRAHMAVLCDENDRLRAECFKLAAGQCANVTGDDGGTPQCAEIAKLRAASRQHHTELSYAAVRALEAWDNTVLSKAHDGMMQERMEAMREVLTPNV